MNSRTDLRAGLAEVVANVFDKAGISIKSGAGADTNRVGGSGASD